MRSPLAPPNRGGLLRSWALQASGFLYSTGPTAEASYCEIGEEHVACAGGRPCMGPEGNGDRDNRNAHADRPIWPSSHRGLLDRARMPRADVDIDAYGETQRPCAAPRN